MKLNNLKPPPSLDKNRKRLGRGRASGSGKTAGRGNKGYHSRSGSKQRPWFEGGQMPLARRLPRRGFKNIFKEKFQIVNICDIVNIEKVSTVDPVVLNENGLIRSALKPVKILGKGDIKIKISITASSFSEAAKNKIEDAGGTAIIE